MARDERNCLARHRDLFRLPLQRAFALRLDESASGTFSCFPYLGEKILLSILVEYELAFGLRHSCFNLHRDQGRCGAAGLDRRWRDHQYKLSRLRPADERAGCPDRSGRDRPSQGMIVAIDGPAASGKGTLARRLAARFGLVHLDTGKLYRAAAALVLEAGADPYGYREARAW